MPYSKQIFLMQQPPRIFGEADYWHVRDLHLESGELYLQFYGEEYRKTPWKEYGLFFIINMVPSQPPRFEFKLGSHDEAKEKGVFVIQNS